MQIITDKILKNMRFRLQYKKITKLLQSFIINMKFKYPLFFNRT
jgi:hypothetical protein